MHCRKNLKRTHRLPELFSVRSHEPRPMFRACLSYPGYELFNEGKQTHVSPSGSNEAASVGGRQS